jgi:hypothetical protein
MQSAPSFILFPLRPLRSLRLKLEIRDWRLIYHPTVFLIWPMNLWFHFLPVAATFGMPFRKLAGMWLDW